MLILTACNVTAPGVLADEKGKSNYDVWVGINHHQIWGGPINGHTRADGAAALLRKIADALDAAYGTVGESKPSPVDEAIIRVMKAPACPRCGSQKLSCRGNGCTWEIL